MWQGVISKVPEENLYGCALAQIAGIAVERKGITKLCAIKYVVFLLQLNSTPVFGQSQQLIGQS